jgi:hypothetical protein
VADRPRRGFAHHHSDEELAAYRRLSAEQKLRWLHEAWLLTADFLSPAKRDGWQKLRKGEL